MESWGLRGEPDNNMNKNITDWASNRMFLMDARTHWFLLVFFQSCGPATQWNSGSTADR